VDARHKAGHDEGRWRFERRRETEPRQAPYFTPSFFCRLDDDVVYWKISFLSG